MKSFIAAILLFVLLTGGIVINSVYILQGCNELCRYAEEIKSSKSSTELSHIKAYWDKHRYFFGLTVSEAKTERMDELIISLFAASKEKNSYEILRICELIKALSEDIATYERISLNGIL